MRRIVHGIMGHRRRIVKSTPRNRRRIGYSTLDSESLGYRIGCASFVAYFYQGLAFLEAYYDVRKAQFIALCITIPNLPPLPYDATKSSIEINLLVAYFLHLYLLKQMKTISTMGCLPPSALVLVVARLLFLDFHLSKRKNTKTTKR